MAVVFALEKLFDDVGARFVLDGAGITQEFGWRSRDQQLIQPPHVDWIPGDDESGDFGPVLAPKYPGTTNPRPLWTPRELFTCYLQGFDAAAPAVERAQYNATRRVLDAWLRAVYLSAHGTIEIDRIRWITKRKEGRFGATLRIVGAILSKTPDSANATAPTDAHAHITLTEKTQPVAYTETFDVVKP